MVKSPQKHLAFTLIELIVVVAIIGVFVSATVFYYSPSPENHLKKQANRFQLVFQYAKDRALLRAEQLAIEFHSEGYQFLTYKDQQWYLIEDDQTLKAHQFDNNIQLDLELEKTQVVLAASHSEYKPQVYILSNGENTAFSITLKELQSVWIITANILGEIQHINEE